MTRDQVTKEILDIPNKNILITLPTGFGKSRIAIELIKHRKAERVLVVVPRNVLKQNWKEEFIKWNLPDDTCVEYTTYVSFHKYAGNWDAIIYDEAHHLSERCRDVLEHFHAESSILLSATVKRDLLWAFKASFNNLCHYNVTVKEAMDNDILPTPRIILLPMHLDTYYATEKLIVNPKAKKGPLKAIYANIWKAKKDRQYKYIVSCTQAQYYNEISSTIDYYKRMAMGGNSVFKNIWLHKCGERLKWLSRLKDNVVLKILEKLRKERTLTFCSCIEQTEVLGRYCINSKNKESVIHLADFNTHRIKHITAVNMLNEGMNLRDCRVGIYANLNSSETIVVQRLGRILRHKDPIIIIPYFKGTRDEELVLRMIKDYDPGYIQTVHSIDEITI